MTDSRQLDLQIYALVSRNIKGLSATAIATLLRCDGYEVRRALSSSPILNGLCYRNAKGHYCPLIGGNFPHEGLDNFTGYYADAGSFMETPEEAFLEEVEKNLSERPSLVPLNPFNRKEAKILRCTMMGLFTDLCTMTEREESAQRRLTMDEIQTWEIAFYPDLSVTGGAVRCSADVLLVTQRYAFALTFLNSLKPSERQLVRVYSNASDFSIIFGSAYRIVAAAVSVRGSGEYSRVEIRPEKRGAAVSLPLCTRDMVYNVLDEAMKFLKH